MPLTPDSLAESPDERSQELSTVASIFPDELTLLTPFSATVVVPVTPLLPLAVQFSPGEILHFSHLPPVHLTFSLPDTYPSDAPPEFAISTDPQWLPEKTTDDLIRQLHDLWEEYGRGPSIFTAIDHIQQLAESSFDLPVPAVLPSDLRHKLASFDDRTKKTDFERSTFDCGICLEPKKGTLCHRIRSCTHVFCRACLVDYYTNLITEGDISNVRCMDPSCGKKNPAAVAALANCDPRQQELMASLPATLPPEELTAIGIPRELVTRYTVLKKKKALEKDPDTIYCPRQWCQSPAKSSITKLESLLSLSGIGFWLPDHGHLPPPPPPPAPAPTTPLPLPPPDKLQICSTCNFAFCSVCEHSWHGPLLACRAANAPLTAEEVANEEYMRLHTTPCPTCLSPVMKSHGCNHMRCPCGTHFCFLCSAYLDEHHPYAHFNTRGIACYQRLWEGEEGDEENRGRIARGEGGQVQAALGERREGEAGGGQAGGGQVGGGEAGGEADGGEVDRGFMRMEELINIIFEPDSDDEFEVPFDLVPDEPEPEPRGRGRGRDGAQRGRRGRGGPPLGGAWPGQWRGGGPRARAG